MMQDWLAGGYLNLELKIRRKEEGSFKTLRDLCESLQNYVTPFKVPLPDLTAPRGGPGTSSVTSLETVLEPPMVVEAVNSFQMIYWVIVFLIFSPTCCLLSVVHRRTIHLNEFVW